MSGWWAKKRARRVGVAGEGGDGRLPGRTPPSGPSARRASAEPRVIDLTEPPAWQVRAETDPVAAAELAERFRARRARMEAQRDLLRLRTRHWSGERVIEEGRTAIDWWEHPDADPYAVLGLIPGAPLSDAAAARRRIAAECHPDHLDQTDRTEAEIDAALRRMVAANVAYDRIRRALRPVS